MTGPGQAGVEHAARPSRIVALEEHFVTADVRDAWSRLDPADRDDSTTMFAGTGLDRRLAELADERMRRMDACGVDVQVLSLTTPGVQNLRAADAVSLARRANDAVAAAVRAHPDRFQGFATLPTPAPDDAARELERAVVELGLKGAMVFGRTGERNFDHPDFLPILEAAAHLRVPVYLHPQVPRRVVRDAYYGGFGDELDLHFATGGIGWHYETGIQILRLILAGAFDRFPELQVITGHWGEAVLFYLERVDLLSKAAKHLRRPVADYVRTNVHVTPSGIFSQRYLRWAVEVLGVDRILFSTDDPYQSAGEGGARRFLAEAPLGDEDRAKVAHGNWERLCAMRG